MKIYQNASELIGKTPLIRLSKLEKEWGSLGMIVAKAEGMNPAGSAKDRVALQMLLDAEEWSAVERKYPVGTAGYILFYTIRKSEKLMNYCRKLSEKTGLKIIVVGGNLLQNIKSEKIKYAVDISPEQWLYLIHNATYVVTNSFHGTAFSVIYRKNFYVELSSATNSRLSHITNILGLQSRIVNCEAVTEITDCNYLVADAELKKLRIESLNFLKKALGDSINNG